ncbi:MAG: hypothetical protein DRH04_11530 [Deltaproteobacteria bacterium]|nr:MAG: hypothetical protein DRH04_11530 [Deltaproteobacteria bacterium]
MGKWFMQVMKIIDRKLALLGRIMRVYRQMEGTIADLEPRRLAELIYEGNKVAMELEALLQEERAWLERFSRERSKKFMSLKAVASCLKEDEQRQRLLSGCAGIDRLATRVGQYSRNLADALQVMDLLNRRCSDFFQQVCPVNLGYQSSGAMNHAEVVFRGNGLNHQV